MAPMDGVLAAIVDVRLPDGDGAALAIELSQRSKTPIVLITGFDLEEPERLSRQMGAQACFLTKPFSPQVLLEALLALRTERP